MSSLCNAKYKNILQKKSWESVNTWMWHNNTSSLVHLVQIHINKQSHGYEKFSCLLFSNHPLRTTKTLIWQVHSLKVTLAGDRGQWGMTSVSFRGSLDRSRTCGSTAARLAPGWLFSYCRDLVLAMCHFHVSNWSLAHEIWVLGITGWLELVT